MQRFSRINLKHAIKSTTWRIRYSPQSHSYSTEVVGIISAIQHTIVTIHTFTDLPWWQTIGLTTIGLRLSLLPLVRYQILTSRKLAQAIPEISSLYQLFQQRIQESSSTTPNQQHVQLFKSFSKGLSACLTLHDLSIPKILLFPMINATIFITFVISVRDLILTGPDSLQLEQGGIFWFQDLFNKDKTFVLPLTAVALSYGALDLSLKGQGKVVVFLKDLFQSILILSIPGICGLPSGVFCYWIPSSYFSIMQTYLMKTTRFQRLLGLPPSPPPRG